TPKSCTRANPTSFRKSSLCYTNNRAVFYSSADEHMISFRIKLKSRPTKKDRMLKLWGKKESEWTGTGHCLTYVPLPHDRIGWVQTCVSLLENFPSERTS